MVFRQIMALSRSLHRCFNEIIKNTGLGSGQVFILLKIVENPGLNQDLLCRILELDKSTVTKGMKTLLQNKYIIRLRDKNDMRNWIVYPSKKGEAVYEEIKKYADEFEMKITGEMEKDEINLLVEMLERISEKTLM